MQNYIASEIWSMKFGLIITEKIGILRKIPGSFLY